MDFKVISSGTLRNTDPLAPSSSDRTIRFCHSLFLKHSNGPSLTSVNEIEWFQIEASMHKQLMISSLKSEDGRHIAHMAAKTCGAI